MTGLSLALVNALSGLAVGVAVYALGYHYGWRDASRVELEPPRPKCPYCDRFLRPITVEDLEEPFPSEARWWCGNESCTAGCFADRPAAKPAPSEEV